VVFAAPIHGGADLELIRGYELIAGKVTLLVPSKAALDEMIATERGLLDIVQRQLSHSKSGSKTY
jgi:hypothetical protein